MKRFKRNRSGYLTQFQNGTSRDASKHGRNAGTAVFVQKGSTLKVMEEFNIQGKQTSFYKYCPGTFGYTLVIHPLEGYVVICPTIFVYCKPGSSKLKFECSAMQFGLASSVKLLKSSCFSHWEYFGIRREDFFLGQIKDTSSNAGHCFWYMWVRWMCWLIVLQKFWYATTKSVTPNWYIYA